LKNLQLESSLLFKKVETFNFERPSKVSRKKERKKHNFILGFRFFVRKILKIGRRQQTILISKPLEFYFSREITSLNIRFLSCPKINVFQKNRNFSSDVYFYLRPGWFYFLFLN